MTRRLFAAAVLLLVPALGFSQDAPTPPPLGVLPSPSAVPAGTTAPQQLNAALGEVKTAFASTEECFEQEAWLKNDLAKKKAALEAEFKGAVPVAFNDLLWQKTQRINKQHALCFQKYDELGKLFTSLHDRFRTIEPKNANVKKQKTEADALQARFLQLAPTAKPYNRPPKRKQASE